MGIASACPRRAADALSLRIANRLVGNPEAAAGLEMTLAGPQISFAADAWVALTGSRFVATVGDDPHRMLRPSWCEPDKR